MQLSVILNYYRYNRKIS